MSTAVNDDLPEVLKSVRTRPLFVMRLDVRKLLIVGATPGAYRRIGVVPGGSFEGERLSGDVLDGGSDWQTVRNDDATTLNVRLVLKRKDDALICMTYLLYSRPQPRSTIGSIALSQSASAIAELMGRFITCSKCCEPRFDVEDRKCTTLAR